MGGPPPGYTVSDAASSPKASSGGPPPGYTIAPSAPTAPAVPPPPGNGPPPGYTVQAPSNSSYIEQASNRGDPKVVAAIRRQARKAGVDEGIALAIGEQESGLGRSSKYDAKTGRSTTPGNLGVGAMQIDPSSGYSAAQIERARVDPEYNAQLSMEIFTNRLKRFGGDTRRALASYNGIGPDAERYAQQVLDRIGGSAAAMPKSGTAEAAPMTRVTPGPTEPSTSGLPIVQSVTVHATPRPAVQSTPPPGYTVATPPPKPTADPLALPGKVGSLPTWEQFQRGMKLGADTEIRKNRTAMEDVGAVMGAPAIAIGAGMRASTEADHGKAAHILGEAAGDFVRSPAAAYEKYEPISPAEIKYLRSRPDLDATHEFADAVMHHPRVAGAADFGAEFFLNPVNHGVGKVGEMLAQAGREKFAETTSGEAGRQYRRAQRFLSPFKDIAVEHGTRAYESFLSEISKLGGAARESAMKDANAVFGKLRGHEADDVLRRSEGKAGIVTSKHDLDARARLYAKHQDQIDHELATKGIVEPGRLVKNEQYHNFRNAYRDPTLSDEQIEARVAQTRGGSGTFRTAKDTLGKYGKRKVLHGIDEVRAAVGKDGKPLLREDYSHAQQHYEHLRDRRMLIATHDFVKEMSQRFPEMIQPTLYTYKNQMWGLGKGGFNMVEREIEKDANILAHQATEKAMKGVTRKELRAKLREIEAKPDSFFGSTPKAARDARRIQSELAENELAAYDKTHDAQEKLLRDRLRQQAKYETNQAIQGRLTPGHGMGRDLMPEAGDPFAHSTVSPAFVKAYSIVQGDAKRAALMDGPGKIAPKWLQDLGVRNVPTASKVWNLYGDALRNSIFVNVVTHPFQNVAIAGNAKIRGGPVQSADLLAGQIVRSMLHAIEAIPGAAKHVARAEDSLRKIVPKNIRTLQSDIDEALKEGAIAHFGQSGASTLGGNTARIMATPYSALKFFEKIDKATTALTDWNMKGTFGMRGEERTAVRVYSRLRDKFYARGMDPQDARTAAAYATREAIGNYANVDRSKFLPKYTMFYGFLKSNAAFWTRAVFANPRYADAPNMASRDYSALKGNEDARARDGDIDGVTIPSGMMTPMKIMTALDPFDGHDTEDRARSLFSVEENRARPGPAQALDLYRTVHEPAADPSLPFNHHTVFDTDMPLDVQAKQAAQYFAEKNIPVPLVGQLLRGQRTGQGPKRAAEEFTGIVRTDDKPNPRQDAALSKAHAMFVRGIRDLRLAASTKGGRPGMKQSEYDRTLRAIVDGYQISKDSALRMK